MKSFFLVSAVTASLVSAVPSFVPTIDTRGDSRATKQVQNVERRTCATIPKYPNSDVLVRLYNVAKDRNASDRVMLSMFEACYAETHCNSLTCGKDGIVGLFQWRPSVEWRALDKVMDVEYSVGQFLDRAIPLDHAQGRNVSAGHLAQMVQRSDRPDQYEQVKAMGQSLLHQAKGHSGANRSHALAARSVDPRDEGDDDDEDCDGNEPTPTSSPAPTSTPTSDPDDDGDCGDDDPPATTSAPLPTPTAPDGGDDDDCGDDDPTSQPPQSTPTGKPDDDDDCDDNDPEPSTSSTPTTSKSSHHPKPTHTGSHGKCKKKYKVEQGDYCSKVADKFNISLEQFYKWNPQVDSNCSNLELGKSYCVKH